MKRNADDEVNERAEKRACPAVDGPAQLLVRPSEVPEYLRESEFYKSLNTEDDEEFYIPADLMKADMNVETWQDAAELLYTLRFWGQNVEPLSLAQFMITQTFDEIEPRLRALATDFSFLETWLCILDGKNSAQRRMEAAMETGILCFIRYLHESGCGRFNAESISVAATGGHLSCLKYAFDHGANVYNLPRNIVAGAVANGHLECVQYLYQISLSYLSFSWCYRQYQQDRCYLAKIAAENGQFECLQFLHENVYSLSSCAEPAAACGSLACLQYIVERPHVGGGNDGERACVAAVKNGHDHCLKYLHKQGFKLKSSLCVTAASASSVACLTYAHSQGCALSQKVGTAAASAGALPCLQYYHSNGGEWTFLICHAAALNGHLNCLQYAYKHGCPLMPDKISTPLNKQYARYLRVDLGPARLIEHVALRRHWGCVLYLILQGCLLTRSLTIQLARKHKDNLLRLAVERGCEVATEVGVRFAKTGDSQGLTYAMEHGCAASTQILCAAARKGHLHCLTYAHEQG